MQWRARTRAGLLGIHLNFLSAFPTEVGAALFGDTFATGLVKRAVVGVIASRAEKDGEACRDERPSGPGTSPR